MHQSRVNLCGFGISFDDDRSAPVSMHQSRVNLCGSTLALAVTG